MDIDSIALRVITNWRSEEYGCEAQKTAVLQNNIITALKFVLREQKNTISDEVYQMQGTVSQFATSKECISHNKALRDAAEMILTRGNTL